MAAKKLTLANLGGGELVSKVDRELKKLCDNIVDPSIKTDAARKINVTIEVKPDKKGETASIKYSVKSSLPGPEASITTAWIAMEPGTQDIALFGMDLRQNELFPEPAKEPHVTEIRPIAPPAPKTAEPAQPAAFAPPMVQN